jgi:uncharacterized phage protein (TIGR02218 family)
MKAISTALANHLKQDSTTIAMLWKIIRQDGTVFGYTDHDKAITFNDGDTDPSTGPITYDPTQGSTASATNTGSDMSVSTQELVGFLESEQITEADIFAGKYDYASIEIRIVNYCDLTMGALLWKKATLGQVKMQNGQFQAELRGLEFYLGTNIGETYGGQCRADLGDTRCTINLASYIQDGSVSTVSDLRTFVPSSSPVGLLMVGSSTPTQPAPTGWFTQGVLTWTSGNNNGLLMEVGSWDGTTIELFENMPYPIQPGDTFTIEPGCDKLITTCVNKFDNINNFRGENAMPGNDQMMIYPNADGSVPGSQ